MQPGSYNPQQNQQQYQQQYQHSNNVSQQPQPLQLYQSQIIMTNQQGVQLQDIQIDENNYGKQINTSIPPQQQLQQQQSQQQPVQVFTEKNQNNIESLDQDHKDEVLHTIKDFNRFLRFWKIVAFIGILIYISIFIYIFMILWGLFEESEDKVKTDDNQDSTTNDGVDYPLRMLELFIALFGIIEWLYWFSACRKCENLGITEEYHNLDDARKYIRHSLYLMFFGFALRIIDIFFNILKVIREKEDNEYIDITDPAYDEQRKRENRQQLTIIFTAIVAICMLTMVWLCRRRNIKRIKNVRNLVMSLGLYVPENKKVILKDIQVQEEDQNPQFETIGNTEHAFTQQQQQIQNIRLNNKSQQRYDQHIQKHNQQQYVYDKQRQAIEQENQLKKSNIMIQQQLSQSISPMPQKYMSQSPINQNQNLQQQQFPQYQQQQQQQLY